MYYRIGLDIGITSVGWCVVETDAAGEPQSILDLGARIFDAAEQPKTGASLAEPRRLARGLRRRLRRRALRIALAKELFAELGVVPDASPRDVNELRVAGLDNLLEEREFAAVILLLIKRRGFKSNSKAQNSAEDGELLSATKRNADLMAEKGYRTVGEMFATEYSEKRMRADGSAYTVYNVRNKGGSYAHTVRRADIRREIETLFAAQAGFGSAIASDEVKDRVLQIFDMQRNFDDGPGKGSKYSATYAVGKCEFLEDEERAPRASYSNERFVALQKINHLKIISGGNSRELTAEEREKLITLAEKNKKTTYAAVRKTLGLGDGERFNALTYSTKK